MSANPNPPVKGGAVPYLTLDGAAFERCRPPASHDF